jgi:hypothetical protein
MRNPVWHLKWLVLIIWLVFSTVFGIRLLTRTSDPARMRSQRKREADDADPEVFISGTGRLKLWPADNWWMCAGLSAG